MNHKLFLFLTGCLLFCITTGRSSESVSLAGSWRFALDRNDAGTNEAWFAKDLPDRIRLPGILQAQGHGDDVSISTPWVMSLYDHFWFLRADYTAYTNAGSVKVPFLSQPMRHYLGAAWYQRDLDIPMDWTNRHVTLFLERPHWKTTVWLDERELGSDISLSTPHEYDLGDVTSGKHRLTIRVDNRPQLPVAGHLLDSHSISDSLGAAWNGIVGRIELRVTPLTWIDEVQIFPEVTKAAARVKVKIATANRQPGRGQLQFYYGPFIEGRLLPASPELKDVTWDANGSTCEWEIPLPANDWSEFHPALYALHLSLTQAGQADDSKQIVFGLREITTHDKDILINGQPINLRMTHFGGDFPLTGYPPTDVASWQKIFRTCQAYGLNGMRFHSWCPPEAAFTAADGLGFYLAPECGLWGDFGNTPTRKFLESETARILKAYGNHPSFILLSPSNEPRNYQKYLPQWAKDNYARDHRHLFSAATGWADPVQVNGGAQYAALVRYDDGQLRNSTGWFGRDYREALTEIHIPVLAHEVGQWCAYPDFDIIKKFTGFIQPGNYTIFRDSAQAHGLLTKNKEFANASGKFQLACYKEEIEANLRTPGLAGFQLLDLHDYTGQGTALVGMLDPFWESKGYATPELFRQFCGPVVMLARLKQRVFTTADTFNVPLEIANFSGAPLTNAIVCWQILDHDGNGKAIGLSSGRTIPVGKNIPLTTITTSLSVLAAPEQYQLCAYLQGTTISNTWNFWLYPTNISDDVPTNVCVTHSWDEAATKLTNGDNVLFLPRNTDLDWSSPPLARVPVFWNALMGPTWGRMLGLWCDTNSPALAGFPTDVSCDWQWTELIRNTRALNLDRLPAKLKPIVSAIDDWNRNYKLGVIFEARVSKGKLLVCTIDLESNTNAVARQLRRSLLDYMAGSKPGGRSLDGFPGLFDEPPRSQFRPTVEISPAQFASLHFDTRVMHRLGARATADGRTADDLIDGDPNTFWASVEAHGKSSPLPHVIEISFPQGVTMTGLVLMSRQNQREHQGDIRDYRLEISNDDIHWLEIKRGQLASTWEPQQILFGRSLTAKSLRLTALTGFGDDTSTALAEVTVIEPEGRHFRGSSADSKELEYKNGRTASPEIDTGGR